MKRPSATHARAGCLGKLESCPVSRAPPPGEQARGKYLHTGAWVDELSKSLGGGMAREVATERSHDDLALTPAEVADIAIASWLSSGTSPSD